MSEPDPSPSGERWRQHAVSVALVVGLALGVGVGVAVVPIADRTGLLTEAEPGATPSQSPDAGPRPSQPVPTTTGEPVVAPGAAGVAPGPVVADPSVAELHGPVSRGTDPSRDGAVAAFTSYSVWLLTSPAAAADPAGALEVVGQGLLNPTLMQPFVDLDRDASDAFEVERGAYRVPGYSGPEEAPDQVMVEVLAPLTLDGSTRWAVVGGVVQWTDGGWSLQNIGPREVPQPSSGPSVADFSEDDVAATLDGLGWATFSRPR